MKTSLSFAIVIIYAMALFACRSNAVQRNYKIMGSIERINNALDSIIDKNAKVEIIASGCDWAEGPVWVESQQMLLFSDVPKNIVYKWTAAKGKEQYLTPAGYTSNVKRGGEIGSNGLALDNGGRLVLCQDGDRQVAIMNADLTLPKPVFTTIANNYQNKKFSTPNDLVIASNGDIFFTDPPYGLEKGMEDPLKEIPYQGVFKVKKNGEVILMSDTITRPNGITLTPNEKTLIVANSDPERPYLYAYDLQGDSLANGRIFYDFTEAYKKEPRNPDGIKTDNIGNVFATGPGGVWIFNKNGKVLGKIRFPIDTSNVALSSDEKTLYVTADTYVLRVRMRK